MMIQLMGHFQKLERMQLGQVPLLVLLLLVLLLGLERMQLGQAQILVLRQLARMSLLHKQRRLRRLVRFRLRREMVMQQEIPLPEMGQQQAEIFESRCIL
jgi:hypothetical protein